MAKIKIKSIKMNPAIFGDSRLRKLVGDIILEKWFLVDGDLKDGDISEDLLKKIGRVLSDRIIEGYENERMVYRDKDGNLLGWGT